MKCRVAALVLFWAAPASATSVSLQPDSVTVTIYHDDDAGNTAEQARWHSRRSGIAFITETRTVDIPAGASVIEFRDVASTIVPQTADIKGLPADIVEQNFDYDLLSPGSLFAKSIGQAVKLVRTDSKSGKESEQTAIVRSTPQGTMLETDGKFEALKCSGLPEKLVFERIPGDLRDTPTLSVHTRAVNAGRYAVRLSYIATGLNWSADYVARIQPDRQSLNLSGFITLSNFSETEFAHIPVEVVSGKLALEYADFPVDPKQPRAQEDCWPTNIDWRTMTPLFARLHGRGLPQTALYTSSPVTAVAQQELKFEGMTIPESKLGDYKLYALPERTNVDARQTKQVQFLYQRNVRFERIYIFAVSSGAGDTVRAQASVVLRLKNKKADGLGEPLPAGTVSVEEQDKSGGPILAGQADIQDTPEDLPANVEFGKAIDVRVEQRITDRQTAGQGNDKRIRTSFEIVIENDKTVPIAFELAQPLSEAGSRIIAEDAAHDVEPGGAIWHLTLKPGEVRLVHYTLETPNQ